MGRHRRDHSQDYHSTPSGRTLDSTPAAEGLTKQQLELVEDLREQVADNIEDSKALQAFVSTSTLVRYLRARSWRLSHATKMLLATLAWRREYKPEAITWEDVAPEEETGKQFLMPNLDGTGVATDRAGRPMLVLRPRKENTKTYERQMKNVIYHLENASFVSDQNPGKSDGGMCWLVDFVGYTYSTAPPVSSAIQTLKILQAHYPERLGAAIAYLPPRIFSFLWKCIQPAMDPVTRSKITFIDNVKSAPTMLDKLIDLELVEKCISGKRDFEFNFEEYGRSRREADVVRQQAYS